MKLLLHILFSCVALPLIAQKQDNVWVFGYRYFEDSLANGIFFTFDDSLKITYQPKPMDFANSSACISDSAGNLLLYSNGCYVETADGTTVPGSEGLNPGFMYNIFCADGVGYNATQNSILLTHPERPESFYLFHIPAVVLGQFTFRKNVLITEVKKSIGTENYETIQKNTVLVNDTIQEDGIHAVRHANGMDWWIIAAKYNSNRYYKLRLSSSEITSEYQEIGPPTSSDSRGEIIFSPDGNKLARFNAQDDLRIFDFDRCTGVLSNPVFIPIQDNADNEIFAGLAWSADGRYLYCGEIKRLLQFDTWAPDIAASKVIVAERELYFCPFDPHLSYMELGPDGYIYGRSLGGAFCMHRIKHPERGGIACEVQQHYYELELPFINLPHFPNFRLGPIDGSPCDTLGLDNLPLAGWRYDRAGGSAVDFTSVSWYNPETWLWDFGDGAQSTVRNPTHTFPGPGAYEVCLQVSNGYGSDTKCKTVWLRASGAQAPAQGVVSVYPNPSTGMISWTGFNAATIQVFDMLGQMAAERSLTQNQADLSTLQNGIYVIRFLDENGQLLLCSAKVTISR